MSLIGPKEVEVELTGERAFPYGEEAVRVRGYEVTFIVPFDGDPGLFRCRPSTWSELYPVGEIVGHEYRLTLRNVKRDPEAFKRERDLQLQLIEENIRRQAQDSPHHNVKIKAAIRSAIDNRRKDLDATEAFGDALGVPKRAAESEDTQPTPRAAARPQRGTAKVKPKVFICHASRDAETAAKLYEALEAAGADPWLDKRELALGDVWETEIKRAVAQADAFLACLRPEFDDIGFRQKEVRWALEALELRPPGLGFIIPFMIEPCELPEWCRRFHAGDMTQPTDIEALIQAVEKHYDWKRKR